MLAPFLTGEAYLAYHMFPEEEVADYPMLNEEILAHCRLSPTQATTQSYRWSYSSQGVPSTWMDGLF